MASQKQIDANRRNAQKSTGPRTPEGKARSSMNALRHGLTAEVAVTYGEDENAYTDFQAGFCNHHQPQGPVEEHLVQEIATSAWRLRRMHIIETGVFDLRFLDLQERMKEEYEELAPHERTAMIYRDDTRGPNTLDALSRYQARAERSFYKALHELERLQALRGPAAAPVSAPAPSPQPVDPLPLVARSEFSTEPRALASGSLGQTNPFHPAVHPATSPESRPSDSRPASNHPIPQSLCALRGGSSMAN